MKKHLLILAFGLFVCGVTAQPVNLLDSTYQWRWNDSTQAIENVFRWYYQYDASGYRIMAISIGLQSGTIVDQSMTTRTNNANGLSVQDSSFIWNGTWDLTSTRQFGYDSLSHQTSIIYQNCNGPCINNNQTVFTYDINNDCVGITYLKWDGNNWINFERYQNIFDTNHNKIAYTYQAWDSTSWWDTYHWWGEYNSNNDPVADSSQLWTGSMWRNDQRWFYEYDSLYNQSSALWQTWFTGVWYNQNNYLYTYDSNNNRIQYLLQDWDGSTWVDHWNFRYTYDLNDSLVSRVYENWDSLIWVFNDSLHYYYSQHLTGIDKATSVGNCISVFPNPAHGNFELRMEKELNTSQFRIVNCYGITVRSGIITRGTKTINCSDLSPGIYFLQFPAEYNCPAKKLVIQ